MQRYTHLVGRFFGIALCAVLVGGLPALVSAQQQVSVNIKPTSIEQKVEPGQVLNLKINVTNLGAQTEELYTNVRNITGIGEDSRPIYSNERDEATFYLASWVSFTDKEITVPPGSTKEVNFTVHVPMDATPGSHFGAILLTKQPPAEFLNGTGVGYEVGSVMNLQIAGEIVEEAAISSFSPSSLIYGKAQVHFSTKVENRGNVFVRPRGVLEITNMFGKKVGTPLPVNDRGAGVFPRASREFETDWLPDSFQIGRFDAVVTLSYGDTGSQTIWKEASFWILPANVIFPTLGGILFLVIAIYASLRMYINRQLALVRSGRAGMRRENAVGLSRLAAVVIAILVSIIIGLLVLFFYFGI